MENDPSSDDSASEDEDLRMMKCFEVDMENLDSVDLTSPPKSSEHYLRMVAAERRQLSAVVVADKVPCEQSVAAQTVFVPKETAVHSSDRKFALSKDRVEKIMEEWSDLQKRIAVAKTVDPVRLRLPRWEDGTVWKQVISHDDGHLKQPTLTLLLSFSASQVHSVFQTIYGWLTDNGEFSEPTLCWFYSLMALMEIPLQPDTYSLLRDFARFCRFHRRDHYADNADDKIARGVSMLIAIIANYFGQKDLGDHYSDDDVSVQ